MDAATILYVGDDFCHRIPVMESRGIYVVRTACSVEGVRSSLAKSDGFSAVTFHNDRFPPAEPVVSAAREIFAAPLVLFRNPAVDCNERAFDLIIPVPMSPEVWSKCLSEAIEGSRRLREYSQQLRNDCVDLQERSRRLFEMAAKNCARRFDYDALFRTIGDRTGKNHE